MPFELYRDVVLIVDIPDLALRAGDIGTIVEQHDVPGKTTGYSVEFFDMTGGTVAVAALAQNQLRLPTALDRPSVRASA